MPRIRDVDLKNRLDLLYGRYGASFLESDPICFPRLYRAAADQEIVAFLATAIAYGRVPQIQASMRRLAVVMGPHPARFVAAFDPAAGRRLLRGFVHRFNDDRDIGLLFFYLRQMLEQSGSIEGFFMQGYSASDDDIGPALGSFVRRALRLDCTPYYRSGRLPASAGVRFFLSCPQDGSTCKRLNLFLRWMVRPDDGVDLGLWRGVSTSQLVIPLDTHVSRIASFIGLTRRRTVNWKMALEVTGRLKRLAPDDPVKYDFALSRLGIVEGCPRHARSTPCELCSLTALEVPA
ncbi:MAG TPA: TIGR02757 family protein [Patescibacteria group bacterium]|jgi:uncharacterized protein (TIGR02757 family)|nr:TIGR02757 family protein [Patescibacteria group bacterium]